MSWYYAVGTYRENGESMTVSTHDRLDHAISYVADLMKGHADLIEKKETYFIDRWIGDDPDESFTPIIFTVERKMK